MTNSATATLARYAVSTSCDALPEVVRDRTRQVILDEVASAFFCRRTLAGDLGARYGAQLGGPPQARIYATGQRVSVQAAAFANGAAGHGDEIDGAHVVGGHPGASIVHAAVAMAERQRATGADLVNAVALGYDVGIRIITACGGFFSMRNRFGLHSDFLNAYGCSAAAGRLMGLDAARHAHAMAMTSFAANAHCAVFAEKRHSSKSLSNGHYAAAGIHGALMAAIGMEGHEDILGGPHGTLHAFGLEGGREAVVRGLGEGYAILGANFKFINSEYPIHTSVEAALALAGQHGIDAADIEAVRVGMPANSVKLLGSLGSHSLGVEDMVAAALVRKGLSLRESPFPQVTADPRFTRLRPRVTLHVDADLDRDQPNGRGAVVTLQRAGGDSVSLRIDHPKGHSLRGGATWQELSAKWREALPECDVDELVSRARRLDELDGVGELLDLLRDPATEERP